MTPAPTLARHLLAWVLGGLALVWFTFIVVGWQTGQHEADELTDGHLASASALLLAYGGGEFATRSRAAPAGNPGLKAHDYQQSLSVVVWDAHGSVLTRTGDAPLPPFDTAEGFATLKLGEAGRAPSAWRAFSRWDAGHERKLMVLLMLSEREDLADDIAQQVIEPALWLLPVIALVLGLAIQRGLRPLYELSADVHALDIHKRTGALTVRTRHEELRVAADAINTLVERYRSALARERSLASEFAHELRTPLASIALQAAALRDAPPAEAAALLRRLERDALRAGEVLSHLLALARASRAELDEAAQRVELRGLAQAVIAEQAPAALAQGHELSLVGTGAFEITGHPVLLELALRNLLENAVSHTPAGTQVEVHVDPARRCLEVRDDGPAGAPAAQGGALGLGLGHRVVEKIAAIHGARFESSAEASAGHSFRLVFAPPDQA
jgi:two-component system sensor histidine kinase QseC